MAIVYQEEDSFFESEGVIYDLNKIFLSVASEPINYIDVNELIWMLGPKTKNDKSRVMAADLSVPILITKYGDQELVVDGEHRLRKAVIKKVKQLPYRRVSQKVMQNAIVKNKVKIKTVGLAKLSDNQAEKFKEILKEASKSKFFTGNEETEIPKQKQVVVLLDAKNNPIGFYCPKKQNWAGVDYYRAGLLFLCKAEQGKGIMQAALKEYFETHQPGLSWIEDSNTRSINLFKTLGFVQSKPKMGWSRLPGHWWVKPKTTLGTESSAPFPIYTNW